MAWALDRERAIYALEVHISISGAAVQWLGEHVADAGGTYLVPA